MAKKIFLCGVGGSGMSALARYFLSQGEEVFGSDTEESQIIQSLKKEGVEVFESQSAENITQHVYDVFICSEAIEEGHPERKEAEKQGIPVKKYFEVLGELSKEYYTIAVAGTHGKSSTTAMIATILRDAGKEVTALVGANIHDWDGKNFLKANEGASEGMPTKKYLVVEACEYRESFLHIEPNGIVLTSIDLDHLDYFKTAENYFSAFKKFLSKIPQFGFFTSFLQGEHILKVLPENFHPRKFSAEEELETVPPLKLKGGFQRENAACALATMSAIKVEKETAIESLSNFSGLSRRFDMRGKREGIIVFDDYAHHPTSVKMAIHTAREFVKQSERKKLWIVFQPHQFSRTNAFYKDFITSFQEADEVLIPNIYESRDINSEKEKFDIKSFVSEIEKHMTKIERSRSNVWGRGNRKRGQVFYKKQVRHTETIEKTVDILEDYAYDGDVIVCMGAGDIYKVSDVFLARGEEESPDDSK